LKKKLSSANYRSVRHALLFLVLVVIIAVPVASGSFWEFWDLFTGNDITGAVTFSSTVASIQINALPVVYNVFLKNETALTVSESTIKQINLSFIANDTDGAGTLDNTTAAIQINKTGEAVRFNFTCTPNSTLSLTQGINYSCSVFVWYFDGGGDWTINASIKDSLGGYGENRTEQLFIGTLTAMAMYPAALTWPTLESGATNQTSNADPITINNTGNKDINVGGITVTGYDLQGQTTTTDFIRAQNFSVYDRNGTSSCSGVNCLECNGTLLQNKTAQALSTANITAGNNSRDNHTGESGQEDFFFCLRFVPTEIARQVYNTTGTQTAAWTITVS